MKNVFDVAKYILEKTGPITTMKLQKLLYYAQAWSLVWDENELFPEDFEAWANGPVCPELFNWHKHTYRISANQIPADKLTGEMFTEDQEATITVVLETYGDKTGRWLSELSHTEAPWKDARGDCKPGDHCHNIIQKGDMAWFYEQYSV